MSPALLRGSVIGAAAAAGILVAFLNRGGKEEKKAGAAAILDKVKAPPENPLGSAATVSGPAPSTTSISPPPPPRDPGPPARKLTTGGHTYQYVPSRLPWAEAKAAAERQGGHLACITSQQEYDALRAYLLPLLKQHNDCCWLGASDVETEGSWKWITGEPFEFKVWAPGAPSNGSDGNQGPQNFLAWQKQHKYGDRGIEWNDLNGRVNGTTMGGALIEWDSAEGDAIAPAVVSKPPEKPVPPVAPVANASTGWQPVTWTDADLQKLSGKVTLTDGWYGSAGNATLDAPPPARFTDGAVRVRIRIDSGARLFQIKPRYAREDALICGLEMPGVVKVIRRDNGVPSILAEWPLADRLQPGAEVRLEMRLTGKTVTMLFNGTTAGSIDTGDTSMAKTLRFMANGIAVRNIEWLPLDGVADPDKVLAASSAWPVGSELAAEVAAFPQKKEAAYAAKLSASLKSLRDSYANRLRALAAQRPAGASVFNAELALITAGDDPPPADAPGTPAALAPLRKTWHDAKAGMEKTVAAAALTIWREHLTKLQSMESALRQVHKLADAADIAPHRSEAEAAVAHFTALVPKSGRPDTR